MSASTTPMSGGTAPMSSATITPMSSSTFTLRSDVTPANYLSQYEAAVYRGDLLLAVELNEYNDWRRMIDQDGMSAERAAYATSSRLVLRAAHLLEGWAVSLARWTLEAAIAGYSQIGPPGELFSTCESALSPPISEVLAQVEQAGEVSRANLSRAIGQCASHHGLWRELAQRTRDKHGDSSDGGLGEFTRLFWTPLHFAATFPSIEIVTELLALSPPGLITRNNGVGYSPLHVAVVHGSLQAAAALASSSNLALQARDRNERTAADLAVEISFSSARCKALLSTMGVKAVEAKKRCGAAAKMRKQLQQFASLRRRPSSCNSEDGGGWLMAEEHDEACDADEAEEAGKGQQQQQQQQDDDEGGPPRRCDVPVVTSLDSTKLIMDHLVTGVPVLVTDAMAHSKLCDKWTRTGFQTSHGRVVLTRELYPYADASAHLYGVERARAKPVAKLIREVAFNASSSSGAARGEDEDEEVEGGDDDEEESTGSSSSGGGDDGDGDDARDGTFLALPGWQRIPFHGDGTERRTKHGDITLDKPLESLDATAPERLLTDFERPPFVNDKQWLLRTETVQFYLGGPFSGAQPHWHAHAWNWLVHGRKRWFLWPPAKAIYTQRHVLDTVGTQKEQRRQQKPQKQQQGSDGGGGGDDGGGAKAATAAGRYQPLVCEQLAGEVLILPELWGHATVNLQPSIGWASELAFDRAYDDGLGETHGKEWWRTGAPKPSQNQKPLQQQQELKSSTSTTTTKKKRAPPGGTYSTL